jgi:hypothetical protein
MLLNRDVTSIQAESIFNELSAIEEESWYERRRGGLYKNKLSVEVYSEIYFSISSPQRFYNDSQSSLITYFDGFYIKSVFISLSPRLS